MRVLSCLTAGLCLLLVVPSAQADRPELAGKRIVFLGDSITHAGGYIVRIEAALRLHELDPMPELINLGLPSETASGLSEPGHPFPRPTIQTRLEAALDKSQPDIVVVCYGMNDGIYHPPSEERFAAYRNGIHRVIAEAHKRGAKVILLTPPPFDPEPLRNRGKLRPATDKEFPFGVTYEGYDEVLAGYAAWILQQQDGVQQVIDIRTPYVEAVKQKRSSDPDFTMTPDGVHPNAAGHAVIAGAILDAWNIPHEEAPGDVLLKLVQQRQKILHDAWLSHVGHERPGMQAGLPIDEAQKRAMELEDDIQQALNASGRRDTR